LIADTGNALPQNRRARRRAVRGGVTWPNPPPMITARSAFGPITASDRRNRDSRRQHRPSFFRRQRCPGGTRPRGPSARVLLQVRRRVAGAVAGGRRGAPRPVEDRQQTGSPARSRAGLVEVAPIFTAARPARSPSPPPVRASRRSIPALHRRGRRRGTYQSLTNEPLRTTHSSAEDRVQLRGSSAAPTVPLRPVVAWSSGHEGRPPFAPQAHLERAVGRSPGVCGSSDDRGSSTFRLELCVRWRQ